MGKWRLKLDLSTTENRLKAFILVSGLLIFIGVATVGAIQITMEPDFCQSCHEMRPEYYTWQVTSHRQFRCTECHIEPGLASLLIHKISAVKEVYLHFTGTYPRPIKMENPIPNITCKKCHSPGNRQFTVSGDLIIPHDRHDAKGVYCVDCHSGVAHGEIAKRKVTTRIQFLAWNETVAREQTDGKLAKPKMNTCLECHTKRNVTTRCEACHKTIAIPTNHEQEDWWYQHGRLAMKDIDYCNKCHSFSLQTQEGTKVSTRDYVRGNVFCYTCHRKWPQSHTADWKIVHKHSARKDKDGCFICHDQNKPAVNSTATTTYCAKCHGPTVLPGQTTFTGGSNQNGGVQSGKPQGPSSHPSNWRQIHPKYVKEKGTGTGRCFECHDTSNCFRCHTNGGKT